MECGAFFLTRPAGFSPFFFPPVEIVLFERIKVVPLVGSFSVLLRRGFFSFLLGFFAF